MKNKGVFLLAILAISAGCAHSAKPTGSTAAAATTPQPAVDTQKNASQTKEAASQANKPTSIDIFVCSRDSDVRELYIEPLSPSGCKLWYSNYRGNPVASSVRGLTHCENVNQNIRKNLETAGYKCGAVSNTAKK